MYEMSCQSRVDARYCMLGAGALGRPRGMEWGGRREEGSGWGTHVYLWRIHFDIWQNQYNIVKFKNKIKLKKIIKCTLFRFMVKKKRPCVIPTNLAAALTSSVMWFLFWGSFSAFKLHHRLILPWSNRTYTSIRPLHFMFPQTIASDCQIFAWLTFSHLSSLCSNRTPKNDLEDTLLSETVSQL